MLPKTVIIQRRTVFCWKVILLLLIKDVNNNADLLVNFVIYFVNNFVNNLKHLFYRFVF